MKVYACFALLVLVLALSSAETASSGGNSTEAPTGTSADNSTEAPTGTSADNSTEAPTGTSADNSTEAPTGTSADNSTEAPAGDTTEAPAGGTTGTTGTPDVTTTEAPAGGGTKAPTGTPDVTTTEAPAGDTTEAPAGDTTEAPAGNTTEAPAADTTKAPTGTPSGNSTSVVISETNLLLGSDEFFIELQGDSDSNILNGLTLVIFDGTDGRVLHTYDNSTLILNPTTGLAIQSVNKTDVQNLTSVAVVLYPPGVKTTEVGEAQDFVGYATGNGILAKNLAETIAPLPLVRSHENLTLSMTRIGNKTKDNSAFVMAPATRNQTNNPTLSPKASATLQLAGNDCSDLVNDTDVLNTLVVKVNKLCQCGMSTRQIVGNGTCRKDYFFNFIISQSYEGQSVEFLTSFQQYVSSNSKWQLNGKNYSVVNCSQQCRSSGHHLPPPTDSKSGNIKVTVAVVLSCIVVFLLILVAVVFYMRSKRRGIMRQFRMTRLQEDDDMDDMDNFMGAIDQEPDFSSSRNNLTN